MVRPLGSGRGDVRIRSECGGMERVDLDSEVEEKRSTRTRRLIEGRLGSGVEVRQV